MLRQLQPIYPEAIRGPALSISMDSMCEAAISAVAPVVATRKRPVAVRKQMPTPDTAMTHTPWYETTNRWRTAAVYELLRYRAW